MGRGIIVLNANFAPASAAGPFKYGAVGYALRAAEALDRLGLLAGFLLYRRDERLDRPRLLAAPFLGYPALELGFHFGMGRDVVGAALADARTRLDRGRLYYQTNVLLPSTHRGSPSPSPITRPSSTTWSRPWGRAWPKRLSGPGRPSWSTCATASASGSTTWRAAAVRPWRSRRSRPATCGRAACGPGPSTGSTLPWSGPAGPTACRGRARGCGASSPGPGPGLVLCTACSRLDAFKNVELFVEAALRLLKSGLDLRALIVGGLSRDGERRRLEGLVDEGLAHRFCFAPRVSRDDLAGLLDELAGRGLFVCPSRYETCGLTPLEAAARGVCTLVADTPDRVEAALLVPPGHRFAPTVEGLGAAVRRLAGDGRTPGRGRVLDEGARAGSRAFDARFVATWRRLTAPRAPGRRPGRVRPKHSADPSPPS